MTEETDTIIVKHLPAELSSEDQVDLLKHFGAVAVRSMGHRGRLKHTVFATFNSNEEAKTAISRLHQQELLGHRLVAELAKSQQKKEFPTLSDKKLTEKSDKKGDETKVASEPIDNKTKLTEKLDSISSEWGINYSYNPELLYLYPAPNMSIITNIANTLAAVPKFYTQVLHLMNKMNLPAPFGAVTPTPPLPSEEMPPLPDNAEGLYAESAGMSSTAMDVTEGSTEESEIESDEETKVTQRNTVKRLVTSKPKVKKKPKLKLVNVPVVPREREPAIRREEVFEQTEIAQSKTFNIKLPSSASSEAKNQGEDVPEVPDHLLTLLESMKDPEESAGFGRFEPQPEKQEDKESDAEEEEWGKSEFISDRRLRKYRLTDREMRDTSVFKNYSPGQPTSRLYIKNVAKQVTEKDLHYIYGRYVNWEVEEEKIMFDIRLMKEGRMKGQAFVTLPSETAAEKALKDTNTFLLEGKPLIVQFARSAKPKENTDKQKSK